QGVVPRHCSWHDTHLCSSDLISVFCVSVKKRLDLQLRGASSPERDAKFPFAPVVDKQRHLKIHAHDDHDSKHHSQDLEEFLHWLGTILRQRSVTPEYRPRSI